jgi:hypothetical protein
LHCDPHSEGAVQTVASANWDGRQRRRWNGWPMACQECCR